MLAINVSIPHLTVARLEQFRSSQRRIQRQRPTHVGVDWKRTILYTKASSLSSARVHLQMMQSQNWLPWQRPLNPRSRLCLHWIAWPRKPTPRIKQRVASSHTAEVTSIQNLPAPPHTPRVQPISEVGGDPHCVWYRRAHIATDRHYCFRFPDFPRSREWRGSKSRFWSENRQKVGFFAPQIC